MLLSRPNDWILASAAALVIPAAHHGPSSRITTIPYSITAVVGDSDGLFRNQGSGGESNSDFTRGMADHTTFGTDAPSGQQLDRTGCDCVTCEIRLAFVCSRMACCKVYDSFSGKLWRTMSRSRIERRMDGNSSKDCFPSCGHCAPCPVKTKAIGSGD